MDTADFYKSIDKQFDNKFNSKNKSSSKKDTQAQPFDDVDAAVNHIREHKSNIFSVRDEICAKFGKKRGRKIYKFLRKIAKRTAQTTTGEATSLSGILFTPGGGSFTAIAVKRP